MDSGVAHRSASQAGGHRPTDGGHRPTDGGHRPTDGGYRSTADGRPPTRRQLPAKPLGRPRSAGTSLPTAVGGRSPVTGCPPLRARSGAPTRLPRSGAVLERGVG